MIDMAEVVTGSERLQGSFPLRPPTEAPFLSTGTVTALPGPPFLGTVSAEVRMDTQLEDFCVGGRIISLPRCVLAPVPKRWRLPAATWDIPDSQPPTRPGSAAPVPAKAALSAAGHQVAEDPVACVALCASAEENPFRYVLSLALPGVHGRGSSRTLRVEGALRYTYEGAPKAALPGARFAVGDRPGTPVRPASSGKPAGAAAAKPGSKPTTAAAGAGAGAPVEEEKAHAKAGEWQVVWEEGLSTPSSAFLSAPSVAALVSHLSAGASLSGSVFRVGIEGTEGLDDEPEDSGIAGGWPVGAGARATEEDYAMRGAISVTLDELLAVGATMLAREVAVEPLAVSEEEKVAGGEAKARREALWSDYVKGKGAAAASPIKGGAKGGKEAPKAAPAKAAPAPAKGKVDPKKDVRPESAHDAPPPPHPYIVAASHLALTLRVNGAINPRPPIPAVPEVTATDLIPPRPAPLVLPPGLDSGAEFRREVANAIALIAAEYSRAIEVHGSGSNVGEESPAAVLASIKASGAFAGVRSALRSAAGRLCRERFARMPGAVDAVGSAGRDEFSARLYAFMVGHMHAALNATIAAVREGVPAPAVVVPPPSAGAPVSTKVVYGGPGGPTVLSSMQAQADRAAAPEGVPEPPFVRLARIAREAEHAGHFARAARVHQTRVALAEEEAAAGGSAGYDPLPWTEYGLFLLRRRDVLKATVCLREAVACSPAYAPALLALGAALAAKGAFAEAVVMASTAVTVLVAAAKADASAIAAAVRAGLPRSLSTASNLLPVAYGLHSMVLEAAGKPAGSGAALLSGIKALCTLYQERGASKEDATRSASFGAVYLLAARALLDMRLLPLARKALEAATSALADSDAPRVQKGDVLTLRARQYLESMNVTVARELRDYMDSGAGPLVAPVAEAGVVEEVDAPSALSTQAASGTGPATAATELALTGVTYSGVIVAGEEALRVLQRACDVSPLNSEAWALRGLLCLAGLVGPRARSSFTGIDRPGVGAPDAGDASIDELADTRRALDMAVGLYVAPAMAGLVGAAASRLAPLPSGLAPSLAPTAAGSEEKKENDSRSPSRGGIQAQVALRADAVFCSASGVGGGLFASDECTIVRLYLSAAAVLLQVASNEHVPDMAAGLLATARDSYTRAVSVGRASAAAAPGSVGGPWALAWLGVGRTVWALGQADDAEAALGEANALDNQSGIVWGWLAYVCACTESGRDREAAAALDQGLRNVSARRSAADGACSPPLLLTLPPPSPPPAGPVRRQH
jgi:tetratricopeptide (TPR) repeat protein